MVSRWGLIFRNNAKSIGAILHSLNNMGDGLAVVEGIRDGLYHVRHNPQRSRLVRLGDRNRNTVNLHYDDPCRGYVNHNPMHVFEDKRYRYDAEQRLLMSDPDVILLADTVWPPAGHS